MVFACTITQWQNPLGPAWVLNGKLIRKKDYLSTQIFPLDDLLKEYMFTLDIRKKILTEGSEVQEEILQRNCGCLIPAQGQAGWVFV